MKTALLAIAAVLAAAAGASAQTITIDFASDGAGTRGNGFSSAASSLVTFTDTTGSGLIVGDFGPQGNGRALAVRDDEAGGLLINLGFSATSIAMGFGNDDPGFSNPGDLAVLTLFQGATQVAEVSVVLNRDDRYNQTIAAAFAGGFDSATFFYRNAAGGGLGLIEIVDDIIIEGRQVQVVPLPAAAWAGLGTLGLAGVMGRLRRRA